MKSARNLGGVPASAPLLADDILEFHAARLLLLFSICGIAGRIDGLTKMAKLDFFVRYPDFFAQVCKTLEPDVSVPDAAVESAMIRHHYGPWDTRYYQILAYLEGRGLLQARQDNTAFIFSLTAAGKELAGGLKKEAAFADLCGRMKQVKHVLGGKSGTWIKNLIYRTFKEEIASRRLGETIRKT